jgi:hypothetical protein
MRYMALRAFVDVASCHRGAQRHQRSPAFRPGNPKSGIGVDRSFPRNLENLRNSSVAMMHTVWLNPQKQRCGGRPELLKYRR